MVLSGIDEILGRRDVLFTKRKEHPLSETPRLTLGEKIPLYIVAFFLFQTSVNVINGRYNLAVFFIATAILLPLFLQWVEDNKILLAMSRLDREYEDLVKSRSQNGPN